MITNYIKNFDFPVGARFFIIAGPCVVESLEVCEQVADRMATLCSKLGIPYVFKASYRKANRTSGRSFQGIGDKKALEILATVREKYKVPVLTDIHESHEAALAAEVADVLQIPAFLCRQTALLEAAAETGKVVNIKKGQFLAPEMMKEQALKVINKGNNKVWLTERGTFLGYDRLTVDFTGISKMQVWNYPVVLDITHSLQRPNQPDGVTGGEPDYAETLARAGMINGVDGLFFETHPNPEKALSDGKNMIPLSKVEGLLTRMVEIAKLTSTWDE